MSRLRLLRERLRDERGFTLVELLVVISVGVIVLGGALGITTLASSTSRRVEQRTDETARGRVGLEQVLRPLHAITCPGASTPELVYASPNVLSFNADLKAAAGFTPDQHTVGASTTGSVTSIKLGDYTAGTAASAATTTQPAWPATTMRNLLNDIVAPTVSTPLFTYYGLAADGVTVTQLNASPAMAISDLTRVTRVDVSFGVQASTTGSKLNPPITFTSALYPRNDQLSQPSTSTPVFGC